VHSSRVRTLSRLVPPIAAVILLPSAIAATTSQDAGILLSQGKPVVTSTNESASLTGAKAVDGNSSTRWASAVSADPQWLRVDLGRPVTVHRVKLDWEAAYAKKYRLEISDDGTHFTTIAAIDNGDGKTDDLAGLSAHGRFLRFVGLTRATKYGYSFWEISAFGTPDSAGDNQAPTVPQNLQAGAPTSTSVTLDWQASTDNVGVTGYDILRNGQVVATRGEPAGAAGLPLPPSRDGPRLRRVPLLRPAVTGACPRDRQPSIAGYGRTELAVKTW
jgi:hypothetical protein